MGRHASVDRRRSVAAWPIIVGVVVVLLVIATVGYFRVTDDGKDIASCSGTTVLPVLVSPGAAPAVQQAAQDFNATKPEARSTCVSVAVTSVPGPAAVSALAGNWSGQRTPAPGLWIADSAGDVAALDAAKPAMTAGHPAQGLADSPVVLALRQAPGGAPVSWASLAAGSAGLVVGIGDPAVDRASAAALQSLVRGASTTPAAASAVDASAVTTAGPVLTRLAGDSSAVPATTDLALAALAGGQSRYTAVPVVESDLARFNAANGRSLTAVYPAGPTAGNELMPVPLTATWVSNAMSDAAAAFDNYLGGTAGTKVLAAAHLRTTAAPLAAIGVDLGTPVTALPDAGAAAAAALTQAWNRARAGVGTSAASVTTPAGSTGTGTTGAGTTGTGTASTGGTAVSTTPTSRTTPTITASRATNSAAPTSQAAVAAPAITFLIDTSGSMSTVTDGQQRMTWVKSAVSTVVQQRPRSSFGVWSFATSTSQPVPLGPLDATIDGTPRSSAILTALNNLVPSGNSYTYGAIRTALTSAAQGAFSAGTAQRLILLTDGGDSTPGLARDALKSTVATLVAQHPGLVLDIVGLSTGVNEQALTEIAVAGGGTFTAVNSLPDLGPTLLALTS